MDNSARDQIYSRLQLCCTSALHHTEFAAARMASTGIAMASDAKGRWRTAEHSTAMGNALARRPSRNGTASLDMSPSGSLSRSATVSVPVELRESRAGNMQGLRMVSYAVARTRMAQRLLRMGGSRDNSESKISTDASQLRLPPGAMAKHGVQLDDTISAVAISPDDTLYAAGSMKVRTAIFEK